MKRFLSSILILTALSAAAYSQEDPPNCSKLSVHGPPGVGGPIEVFTIKLEPDVEESKLEIKWTVENGKVVSGQGTKEISVRSEDRYLTVRATATVSGPGECLPQSGSDTGVIIDPGPELIAQFGDIPDDELFVEIDSMLSRLKSEPYATGYIVNYGQPKQVADREKKIREIIASRDFEDRIIFVNAGLDKDDEKVLRTRHWIVPPGADASTVN